MLKELSLEVFVREVATATPAPSSGSVAALAGAQAAGLLSMYCNVSQDRERLGDSVDQIQKTGEEARYLMNRQLEMVDEDTVAFNQVMEAFRTEKTQLANRQVRDAEIVETVGNAAEITLQSARGALRTLFLISEVACKGNPSALTDLGLANLQAIACLTGSYYNILANLALLKNRGNAAVISREAEEILNQGQELFRLNQENIEEKLQAP